LQQKSASPKRPYLLAISHFPRNNKNYFSPEFLKTDKFPQPSRHKLTPPQTKNIPPQHVLRAENIIRRAPQNVLRAENIVTRAQQNILRAENIIPRAPQTVRRANNIVPRSPQIARRTPQCKRLPFNDVHVATKHALRALQIT